MKKIHVNLIGEEVIDSDYDAIIKNNKIQYLEDNINVVITKYQDYVEIKRECNEYKITLNLKMGENISCYQVFGSSKVFELKTIVTKYNVSDNIIEIDYDLEGNKFLFKLEVIS